MKLIATVNDLPTNPERYTYFVCRAVEGELWFYGAWYADQKDDAIRQAVEVDGLVLAKEV